MYIYEDYYYYDEYGQLVAVEHTIDHNESKVYDITLPVDSNSLPVDSDSLPVDSNSLQNKTDGFTTIQHIIHYDLFFLLTLLFFFACFYYYFITFLKVFCRKRNHTNHDPLLNCKILIVSNNEEEEEEEVCSICLDFFQQNQRLLELPCEHKYHESCIVPWLENNDKCPLCRDNV